MGKRFKPESYHFKDGKQASSRLSDRVMGRSQYFEGVGYLKPKDSVKILNLGRPRLKSNRQLKSRVSRELSKPHDLSSVLGLFSHKSFVAGIVLIGIILGGISIYQSPAFHSYHTNPALGDYGRLHDAPSPFTVLWSDQGISGDTSGWNLSPGQRQSYIANYDGKGNNTYSLDAFANNASVMITKQPLTNLAEAQGKMLAFFFEFDFGGSGWTPGPSNDWGFFLTTNNTAPAHAPGGTGQWDALNDPSVIFLTRHFCASNNGGAAPCGGFGGTSTYTAASWAIKKFGVTGETLLGEDVGGCTSGGSCIMSGNSPLALPGPAAATDYLNFTGTGVAASSSACRLLNQGTPNVAVTGSGCSFTTIVPDAGASVFQALTALSQVTNWLTLTKGNIYLGIYSKVPGVQVFWRVDTNGVRLTSQMNISAAAPLGASGNVPPFIDTGGFFGPIIQALINIGVFILQSLVQFFTLVTSVVRAALDAIGGFVGLGAVGTALFSMLSAAGNFIGSVISTLGSQLTNIVGFITNAASAIVAFLNSGGSFIWTQVSNFFSLWALVFPLFNTVFLVMTAFSQSGVQLAQYGLILWWIYGIYVVLEQGTDKWWSHWVSMGEEAFKKVFNLGYWMIELAIRWLTFLKNLLAQWA